MFSSVNYWRTLNNAAATAADIVALTSGSGLKGDLITSIASIYERAVSGGMGDHNLPELPRAVAKEAGVDLRPETSER